MGDDPFEDAETQYCPSTSFPDGLEPVTLFVDFGGPYSPDPDEPTWNPPPSGIGAFTWFTCNWWAWTGQDWGATLHLATDAWQLVIESWLLDQECTGNAGFSLGQSEMLMVPVNTPWPWEPWMVRIETADSLRVPPASWEPAPLIVVPTLQGYFGEQGYTGLDDKHYRYCNHSDGTNVKLILE